MKSIELRVQVPAQQFLLVRGRSSEENFTNLTNHQRWQPLRLLERSAGKQRLPKHVLNNFSDSVKNPVNWNALSNRRWRGKEKLLMKSISLSVKLSEWKRKKAGLKPRRMRLPYASNTRSLYLRSALALVAKDSAWDGVSSAARSFREKEIIGGIGKAKGRLRQPGGRVGH